MHRQRQWWIGVLLALALLATLTACGDKKKPAPPTATPTDTPQPSPVGGSLVGGTPFPPTWTPGKPPTSTPRAATVTSPPTLPPAPTWTALPDYCYELTVIGGDTDIRTGTSITLRWTPISGFSDYLLLVYVPGGGVTYQQVVKGTEHTVPGEVFRVAGAYGWEIWPLTAQGERTCFPAGGEIVVRFR